MKSSRNITVQSLGMRQSIAPVVTSLELARGDRLLLCSDGLSNKLNGEEILNLIAGSQDTASACRLLIEKAKGKRADDNITAVLALVEGEAFSPPEELSALVLSEAIDESGISEDLVDLTDVLSPSEKPFNHEEEPDF